MQNDKSIFLVKLSLFFVFILQASYSQAFTPDLLKADSLFENRSYKEAMEIYVPNYQNGLYSPAMLLKMAFIAEGIGDKEQATLYLGKYYDINPNPQIIEKIKNLTGQSSLSGYEVSDKDRFLLFLVEYKESILLVLSVALLISLGTTIWTKWKKNTRTTYWPVVILVLVIFMVNNFLMEPRSGLVTHSPSYIVSKPTAGGEMLEMIEPGHRLKIRSSKDIWYEIEWKNRVAYIRKDQVTRM
ncbi:MAG: hypothetical protein HWE15_14925 [Algoriphagus sp.]|uniref:tetratricopeptide repeat protein n=1 Tax=Algoriphagus sp. TaxID=1872435 RepID=UPI0017F23F69|nr:hypothetical protein [Algoriphagus sp.]NVJ87595.1 hypothetical protein [Algoriphagus sp.]